MEKAINKFESLKNILRLIYKYLKNIAFHLVVIFIATLSGFIVASGFDALNKYHWALGVVAVLLVGLILLFAYPDLKKRIENYDPRLPVIGIFLLMIIWIVLALSELSFILYRTGLAEYEPIDKVQLANLATFYLWKFFDMIPGIRIWETLKIESPMMSKNWIAGLPILIFQIIMIVLIVKLFKKWMTARGKYFKEKTIASTNIN